MGKSSPSPPPAPDPVATAQAQTASNVATAEANARLSRVNQVTPQGTLTYSYDPNQPNNPYTATTALSPAEQQLLNLTQQAQTTYGNIGNAQLNQVQGSLSTPYASGAPGMTMDALTRAAAASAQPINTNYDQMQTNTVNAAMARLQPSIDQQQNTLNSSLLAQGIPQGSAAWNNAQRQFQQGVDDQRNAILTNAASQTGQAIQNTAALRGIPIGEAGQIANIASPAMQQALAMRDQPLQEASSLLTGGQVAMPQFANVPGVQQAGTDVGGITNQSFANRMAGYNAQVQAQSAQQGGMYGLAGTVAAAAAIAI